MPSFTLTHGSSTAEVYAHGATLTSWKVNGIEQIFLSKKAVLDGSKAIRGGIPLVFPHFGKREGSDLPQHGFARSSTWSVVDSSKPDVLVLQLTPEGVPEQLRKLWPHEFKLLYTVSLGSHLITTKLDVYNTAEDDAAKEWDFTVLLHTYLRVPKIETTHVAGLKGVKFTEKINGITDKEEEREQVTVAQEVDRIYSNVKLPLTVHTDSEILTVSKTTSFNDVVVWNPWVEKAKAMADFDDDEYKSMLCVEIGTVNEFIQLKPGKSWSGSQTLSAKI